MEELYKKTLDRLKAELRKQLLEIEADDGWLWHHPETEFKEAGTQKYCLEVLRNYGSEVCTWLDVIGFAYTHDTGRPGPCVMVVGEMGSLICYSHPDCNPETGAARAYSHSIQVATAMGVLITLTGNDVLENSDGKVMLAGIPAEECLEIRWRTREIQKGRLRYLCGKAGLLYQGTLDGVDIIISIHAGLGNDGTITVLDSHNGFISKSVTFQGRSAHVATSPENGVNVLYMADMTLTVFNSLRETFKGSDTVRVHPIIIKGGTAVDATPEEVCVECLCHVGKTETVPNAPKKFDQVMRAGAYAFGEEALVRIQPGYLPYHPLPKLDQAAVQTVDDILGKDRVDKDGHNCDSMDLGDLNEVTPGIQVFVNYMYGDHHGADYRTADREIYETAPLLPAVMACCLLDDRGVLAKKVKAAYRPPFANTEDYRAYVKSLGTEQVLP